MFTMNVRKNFWSDAILTIVYLMNRMPTRVLSHKSLLKILVLGSSLFPLPLKTFG